MPKPSTQTKTTEVIAQAENDRRQRRRFTLDDKLRIVAEAERSTEHGAIAALLRREGLYASQLATWREQMRAHGKAGLESRTPGPKTARNVQSREIERLEKRNERLERKLSMAHKLLELAGKAHEILGVALPSFDDEEKR